MISEVDIPACFQTEDFVRKDTCRGCGAPACEKCYFFNHYIIVMHFPVILPDVADLGENFLKNNDSDYEDEDGDADDE